MRKRAHPECRECAWERGAGLRWGEGGRAPNNGGKLSLGRGSRHIPLPRGTACSPHAALRGGRAEEKMGKRQNRVRILQKHARSGARAERRALQRKRVGACVCVYG